MEYQKIANGITKVSKTYNKIIQKQLQMRMNKEMTKERYISPKE